MKIKDIPQFISVGDYEVDIFLDSLEETLERYKDTYGLELHPKFQRKLCWTDEQQTAYIEFYLRGGRTARVIYFNSPAYGNDERGDLDDTLVCVDGLQRLTAFRRFLNNEIKVFGLYYREFEDKLTMRNTIKFNINCLTTRKEVMQWYVDFNSGGVVHTEEEINRVKRMIAELE